MQLNFSFISCTKSQNKDYMQLIYEKVMLETPFVGRKKELKDLRMPGIWNSKKIPNSSLSHAGQFLLGLSEILFVARLSSGASLFI